MEIHIAVYCSICLHMFLFSFFFSLLKHNITLKLIPPSYVKEASLTKTYVYWMETDLTIHSSIFRSVKCICYCTFHSFAACSMQH